MKVLMVCLGNICRSPMAEGILRKKSLDYKLDLHIDSAGTGDWHTGESPDPRAIRTANFFGINISKLKARQFNASDFDNFDKIFAMDQSNMKNILALARNESDKNKVELLLNHIPHQKNKNVPDPWFGGEEGFTDVFNLLDEACEYYINKIK